jgi:hypothetical protein
MKTSMVSIIFFASVLMACADDAPPTSTEAKATCDPELRRELLDRTKTDQRARKAIVQWMGEHGTNGYVDDKLLSEKEKAEQDDLVKAISKIDADNTQWLKGVIEKHGWPTKSMARADGANAAWLLVQHADADAKFQRKCLDLMTALPKDEVDQSDVAYLTDRVLLAEGKKQLYGTQFEWVEGKFQPRPLEDEANVDKLRADVGLPTLAEYAKVMKEHYGGGSKK